MFNFGKVCYKLLGGISGTNSSLALPNLAKQPSRSTFVLKRRYELKLHPKDGKHSKLNHKAFVYDLVENTDLRKKPPLNIILKQNVPGVGQEGDMLSMRAFKAYNEFLLPGLAIYASPENIKKYDHIEKKQEQTFSTPTAAKTLQMLSVTSISVVMSVENPWTLEPWHVKSAFRKCGIIVPEEAITIPDKPIKGPDMNIQNKEFYVTVTINKKDQCKVRCRIHHYSPDPTKQLEFVPNYWKYQPEPIFLEDKAVLDSLPKHPKWY